MACVSLIVRQNEFDIVASALHRKSFPTNPSNVCQSTRPNFRFGSEGIATNKSAGYITAFMVIHEADDGLTLRGIIQCIIVAARLVSMIGAKPNKSRQINRRAVLNLSGFRRLGVLMCAHKSFVPESGGVCAVSFKKMSLLIAQGG
jgi:hypothetical protein